MSSAINGLWSALGALAGGAAGAAAGRFAANARPRHSSSYVYEPQGMEVEDAMVIGGAIGSVLGAFVAGTVAGNPEPVKTTANQVGTSGVPTAWFP